ncbi:MAG: type II toxin-antitoxin system PemK/MazF family toxin [Treponema sp.]|jgi:mRNA interferase MazF|nr:type II toxin-antitoxin system PemK/MazF family toxin [Treponema sp.]
MKQGEIWTVNLDPTIGAEIKKIRPALLLNVDALGRLPLRVIAPITDWKERYAEYPWMVRIDPAKTNGITKTSAIDCFQVRPVSVQRLVTKLGYIDFAGLLKAQEAIAQVVGLR